MSRMTWSWAAFSSGALPLMSLGQVIVVFAGKPVDYPYDVLMGRRFDATGNPLGGTFYVSEKELPKRRCTSVRI